MLLKLKRFGEGVWFDYPEGGKFKIRAITPKHFLEFREKSKKGKQIIKNTADEDQIVDNYDDALMAWLIFDYALAEWSDLEVEGAANKDEIMEAVFNDRLLRDWIMERASQVFKTEEKAVEGELKNSVTSLSG